MILGISEINQRGEKKNMNLKVSPLLENYKLRNMVFFEYPKFRAHPQEEKKHELGIIPLEKPY